MQATRQTRFVRGLTLAATLSVAFAASATTYYWKGANNVDGLWSDLSNWSTESMGGADATALPGAGDTVQSDLGNYTYANFLIDADYTVKNFSGSYRHFVFKKDPNSTVEEAFTVTTATELGGGSYRWFDVYAGVVLLCPETASFNMAGNDASAGTINVYKGGEVQIYGATAGRHYSLNIENGGELTFAPKSYSKTVDSGNRATEVFEVKKGGTLNLPNGINCQSGAANKTNQVNVADGALVTLGGDVNSAVQGYKFTLKGGILRVTGDSTFGKLASIGMTAGMTAEIEVADGKRLIVANVDFAAGAKIVKSGAGILALGQMPDALEVQGGVAVAASVGDLAFDGDRIVLVADAEKGLPVLAKVAKADGTAVKIDLRNLARLPDGRYEVVAAGNDLELADYDIMLDPTVNASVDMQDDGSVVVVIDGLVDDPNPFVWNPQNDDDVWSADCPAWLNGDSQTAFESGHFAKFTGQEALDIERIKVVGTPNAGKVLVSGDRDYTLVGGMVDARTFVKDGTGALILDNEGFSGRAVELNGGTLGFSGNAARFVAKPVEVDIPNFADVTVKGVSMQSVDAKLITFRYGANSIAYDTATQFTTTNLVDSIKCLTVASPVAPDGTSLSGKSLWASGKFCVEPGEAGDWTFKGKYDDNIMLVVDGKQLFNTANYTDEKTAVVNLESGWHSFDIRAKDGSGGWGNANAVRVQKPGATLVAFTEENVNMDWRGSEIDPAQAPKTMILKLNLGNQAKLTLGSAGVVFAEGSEISDSATLAIDVHSVPANVTFLRCEDASLLAVAAAKLIDSIGSIGEIVETEDGLAWTMNAVFESDTITDLNDPNGWMIGVTPGADEHVTITGAKTYPVMDADTIDFAEIKVVNGAGLAIVAERTVNALTLEAGTKLDVDIAVEQPSEFFVSGYIPTTEMLCCEDDTDHKLSDYVFSATMGGKNWTDKFMPSDFAFVKEKADGSVSVQFQRADDTYTKVVYVDFVKRDGKIYAKGDKARYINGRDNVGKDMDTLSLSVANYVTADDGSGYGVKDIWLKTKSSGGGVLGETVTALGPFATTGSGEVAVDVAEGNVLDLSGVTVTTGAKLVKTGAGTIVFGETAPTNVEIAEGIVAFQPEVEYDLTGITIGEDAVVKVATAKGLRPAAPVKDETTGKTKFYGPGFYVGVGGWNDDANWISGKPGAEDIVHVAGEGSVLAIDDATATMPTAIDVRDGAAVKVLVSVTLPEVTLAPTAAFAIGDNADKPKVSVTMPAAPKGAFALAGEEVQVPSVTIASNVTMTVTGNIRFRNVFLTLCGKLYTSANGVGDIRFGYAEANETSYFGMLSDGAEVLSRSSSSNGDTVRVAFMNPEDGGRIIPLGTLTVRKTSCSPTGWADWRNLYVGYNNPTDEPFDMVVDGNSTLFSVSWNGYFGGAARVRFVNGASLTMNSAMINHGTSGLYFRQDALVTFEGKGSNLCFAHAYSAVNFEPAVDGLEQVTFKNGASLVQHGISGKNTAVVTFDDGVLTVPNNYRPYDLLKGVKAAAVPEGKWMTVRGEKVSQGSDWDRVVKFTNAPITGEGSLMVTNTAAGKLMDVTIVNGANTATGVALAAAEEGTMLRFADGANWAGTVVANGHVALTNLTDGAAATSVTFGNLKLASGEFPIRVARNSNGALVGDQLNLTGEIVREAGDTGVIRLLGEELEAGETLVLGKAPAGAWSKASIKTASGRQLAVVESKPDEQGLVTVSGKIPTGFVIMIQ